MIYLLDPQNGGEPARLPPNYTDPAWFAKRLTALQTQRPARGEQTHRMLIDGLDEAPAPAFGEVPFAYRRPCRRALWWWRDPARHPLPVGEKVERIDVTGRQISTTSAST